MPSQWERVLLCNDVSHWLGANLESAPYYHYCVPLGPRLNGWCIANIFKFIFFTKNCWSWLRIIWNLFPSMYPFENKPAFVLIMVFTEKVKSYYLKQCYPTLLMHVYVSLGIWFYICPNMWCYLNFIIFPVGFIPICYVLWNCDISCCKLWLMAHPCIFHVVKLVLKTAAP